jgi:hypothetical protein
MKRFVLIAGIALSILSCAQHDNSSPDTSGVDPQAPNQATTGDTAMNSGTNNTTPNGGNGGNNMNNDGSNNNQQVNTGDSTLNNNRRSQ